MAYDHMTPQTTCKPAPVEEFPSQNATGSSNAEQCDSLGLETSATESSGVMGPVDQWDALTVDAWMTPGDEGECDIDLVQLRTNAVASTSEACQALIVGFGQWADRMEIPDALPWYSSFMVSAVEDVGKEITKAIVAPIAALGPAGAAVAYAMGAALQSTIDASVVSRVRSAVALQDGELFSRGTILDLQQAFCSLVLDSSKARRAVLLSETRCEPLQAYVAACDAAGADQIAQNALLAATRVWLKYARAAERVHRPGGEMEASEENAVTLTFGVDEEGSLHWQSASMTGLPKELRSRLAQSPLSELPFVARSVGRGAAGVVVEQDLDGAIDDRSEAYATGTLERIARSGPGIPSASANEGVWIVAEVLKRSSVNGLGLALEGA